MKKRYHCLRVITFVQSTEDRDKVIKAIKNVLSGELSGKVSTSSAEGVFKNPIEHIVVELTRAKDIERVVEKWSGMDFWTEAAARIEDRLDEDLVYHVRLDKEKAYLGDLVIWKKGEAIEVQLKPATFPVSREKAIETLLPEALV
ncbi:MAG: hypothetical protein JXA22_03075 [Candidatus Thermoplasmatota archaeon]|nr:hypothetical protein [Candidatus Thermoplasmatota archaeon]